MGRPQIQPAGRPHRPRSAVERDQEKRAYREQFPSDEKQNAVARQQHQHQTGPKPVPHHPAPGRGRRMLLVAPVFPGVHRGQTAHHRHQQQKKRAQRVQAQGKPRRGRRRSRPGPHERGPLQQPPPRRQSGQAQATQRRRPPCAGPTRQSQAQPQAQAGRHQQRQRVHRPPHPAGKAAAATNDGQALGLKTDMDKCAKARDPGRPPAGGPGTEGMSRRGHRGDITTPKQSACQLETVSVRERGAFPFLNHPQHSRDFRRSGPRQYGGRTTVGGAC
jgi:hypothetical protein